MAHGQVPRSDVSHIQYTDIDTGAGASEVHILSSCGFLSCGFQNAEICHYNIHIIVVVDFFCALYVVVESNGKKVWYKINCVNDFDKYQLKDFEIDTVEKAPQL